MIERPEYLQTLINFKDKELIKIVTGIRRCGKSTLFELYIDYLLKNGVKDKQIIHINLEDHDFDQIIDYNDLYNYVEKKLNKNMKNYVFLKIFKKHVIVYILKRMWIYI